MTDPAIATFIPFAPRLRSSAQSHAWRAQNCDRCTRGYEPDRGDSSCEMERALSKAHAHDGRIPVPIARRIGLFTLPGGKEMPALRARCAELVEGRPGDDEIVEWVR